MPQTPWRVTKVLDEEIEKGPHLGHAMPTVRIDRVERQSISRKGFDQHWFESTLTDGIGGEQIANPYDPASRDREPQRDLATIDAHSRFDINGTNLAAFLEWPPFREWKNNAVMIAKVFGRSRYAAACEILGSCEEPSPDLCDLSRHQRRIINGSTAYANIGVLSQQIDNTIRHHEFEIDFGKSCKEVW